MTKQIAFLTDIHLDEQLPSGEQVNPAANLEIVLHDVAKRGINTIVFGGDIGEASAHPYFFNAFNAFSFQLILGNHDKYSNVKTHFSSGTDAAALYYLADEENCRYLFLDTSAETISNTQLQWLQSALDTEKQTVIFLHHPVLPVDTPVDRLYPLANRDQLKSVLLQHQQNTVLCCGHYHMNDERQEANIRQFITPALSYQIVKDANAIEVDSSHFGYRILSVYDNRIETAVVRFGKNFG
jgi:3',5'-cyclic AMP phosphodiesterase CpdA